MYLFSSASFRQNLSASLVRMFPSWGRAVLPELGFQLHRSFLHISLSNVRDLVPNFRCGNPLGVVALLLVGPWLPLLSPVVRSFQILLYPICSLLRILFAPILQIPFNNHLSLAFRTHLSPYRLCPGGNRPSCSQQGSPIGLLAE